MPCQGAQGCCRFPAATFLAQHAGQANDRHTVQVVHRQERRTLQGKAVIVQEGIFQGAHGVFLVGKVQQNRFAGTRQGGLDLFFIRWIVRAAGERFHLQIHAVAQFFGGVLVATDGRWNLNGSRLIEHAQQPGGLADTRRGSQQRQAATPEGQASIGAKVKVGLGIAQGSGARHTGMIFF